MHPSYPQECVHRTACSRCLPHLQQLGSAVTALRFALVWFGLVYRALALTRVGRRAPALFVLREQLVAHALDPDRQQTVRLGGTAVRPRGSQSQSRWTKLRIRATHHTMPCDAT